MKTLITMIVLAVIALLVLLITTAYPASASHPPHKCGDRKVLLKILKEQFKRKRVARAMTGGGNMIEFYAGKNGDWVSLMINPNGMTCVSLGGRMFEIIPVGDAT